MPLQLRPLAGPCQDLAVVLGCCDQNKTTTCYQVTTVANSFRKEQCKYSIKQSVVVTFDFNVIKNEISNVPTFVMMLRWLSHI